MRLVSGTDQGSCRGSRVFTWMSWYSGTVLLLRVLREVLVLDVLDTWHFTNSRRGALSVARTANSRLSRFTIHRANGRSTAGLVPAKPLIRRHHHPTHQRHPFRHPPAAILAMFFGPLVVTSGNVPPHWRSHTGMLRPCMRGDVNRIVSLSTNTSTLLPLCYRNSPTTHPLVTET